jgi:7-cyano-7-deazaguanine reductase
MQFSAQRRDFLTASMPPAAAGYNGTMSKQPRYTAEHAAAGLDRKFPAIETWPNQFPGYEIVVDDPEFTSVCPKTGLPDFGHLTIRYVPHRHCLELKSLKEYLQSYRNLAIFQENIVNRVLEDVVRWANPEWVEVKGDFRPRGGISTVIVAHWPRPRGRKPKGNRGGE